MTQIDDQAGGPAAADQLETWRCGSPWELLERARVEGVSLVGPGGLLAGVTKTVLQAALDAEVAGHLGYEGVSGRRLRWVMIATVRRRRRC